MLVYAKTETEQFSEMSYVFKKLGDGQGPKKRVSINFRLVQFSLLDFLTLEAGSDRLSWNIGMELTALRYVMSQKTLDIT